MGQQPIPVEAGVLASWKERVQAAHDNILEILEGLGGDPALPPALKERLAGALAQLDESPAEDEVHRVPQPIFRDCHDRCRLAEVAMNIVLGLTAAQKQIGYGLRDVANEMRDAGNPYGMGLT